LPSEFLDLARQVIAGSTFTSNILLLLQTGYFDIDSNLKPLLHLWSLGVEEQYYLVWPAILVLAHRTKQGTPAVIFILGVVSFVFMLAVPQADAFYLPPSRFWELTEVTIAPRHPTERRASRSMATATPNICFQACPLLCRRVAGSCCLGLVVRRCRYRCSGKTR
jgi:peptidoglycan/LPS O-acetylase OafA/YrhL